MSKWKGQFYDRYGLRLTLLGCALLPFVVYASLKVLATNANEVKNWLPSNYVETTEFEWFRRHFPNDEFLLVTWEGCTLDDRRLDEFVRNLQTRDNQLEAHGQARFPRIITGRSAMAELLEAYPALSRDAAVAKLKGSLVGPDDNQTCAIVSLTDEARRDVHQTLSIVEHVAESSGVSERDLKLGGTPVVNVAIDRVSAQALNRVVVVCCIVVSLIAWWLIRNLALMLLILVTGLYAAALSLSVLWLSGTTMNAILITMIPMVYVTATSGAIHLCNYYIESVREAGLAGAADRAVAHAWLPLGLAAATTAAGLLSICYTDLTMIRTFGIYSAIGVVLSWGLLVVWLPSALAAWRPVRVTRAEKTREEHETGEATLPAFWRRWGEFVTRHPHGFSAACLVFWLASLPGLWQLRVSIDFMKEFRDDSKLVRTYAWLEEKLGPLMPLEVVLRIDEKNDMTTLQRMRLVERLQRRFESLDDTGGAISAATFAPEVEASGPAWLREGIRNRRLQGERSRLMESGYLAEAAGEELWRISVRVVALREVNYAGLIRQLHQQVEEELASDRRDRAGIRATYTGVAPVLFRARQSLVDGLFWGIMTDLALIVITVTILMRHWSSGLLMSLTTLFPAFVVLGYCGWMGIRIDLGAIMAPCVALGVTVDDVVHFLLWFRTGIERGMNRRDAVLLAWRGCVRPMYQSCMLLGLGMACLVISDFLPILQFGMIMTAMLTVGLIGNLIFLPSLLTGPLGGVIAAQARARSHTPSHVPRVGATSPG